MKAMRILSALCAMALLITVVPAQAATYQVGDDVEFNAGDSDGSITGSIESDSSSNSSSGSTSVYDWAMSYRSDFIEEAHKVTNPYTRMVYKDNSYVLTYREPFSSPWTIETLMSTSSMSLSSSKSDDRGALNKLGNILPTYTRTDIDRWTPHISMVPGYNYRTVTVAGRTLYYVTEYEDRIEILEKYFETVGWDENYDLLYICEYSIQDVEHGVVYSQRPTNWYGTDYTHFWEMECFDFETNQSLGAKQVFSDSKLTQQFAVPGKYHVTATQIMSQITCDVATWRRREYLVEPYLGLVIWAQTSYGSNLECLNPNLPLVEQMETICHEMTYNYQTSGKAHYLTQYDAWIDIVDANSTGPQPPSPWGDEYDTERIG